MLLLVLYVDLYVNFKTLFFTQQSAVSRNVMWYQCVCQITVIVQFLKSLRDQWLRKGGPTFERNNKCMNICLINICTCTYLLKKNLTFQCKDVIRTGSQVSPFHNCFRKSFVLSPSSGRVFHSYSPGHTGVLFYRLLKIVLL